MPLKPCDPLDSNRQGAQQFVATYIGGLLGMALLLTEQQALLIIGSFALSVISAVAGVHFKVDLNPNGRCLWASMIKSDCWNSISLVFDHP